MTPQQPQRPNDDLRQIARDIHFLANLRRIPLKIGAIFLIVMTAPLVAMLLMFLLVQLATVLGLLQPTHDLRWRMHHEDPMPSSTHHR